MQVEDKVVQTERVDPFGGGQGEALGVSVSDTVAQEDLPLCLAGEASLTIADCAGSLELFTKRSGSRGLAFNVVERSPGHSIRKVLLQV